MSDKAGRVSGDFGFDGFEDHRNDGADAWRWVRSAAA
jgi:hypothetical protein